MLAIVTHANSRSLKPKTGTRVPKKCDWDIPSKNEITKFVIQSKCNIIHGHRGCCHNQTKQTKRLRGKCLGCHVLKKEQI